MNKKMNDAFRSIREAAHEQWMEEVKRTSEARQVINGVARTLGIRLEANVQGDGIYSPENMARVVMGTEILRDEYEHRIGRTEVPSK